MAINDNDGWLESGHEWVGQQVLRIFPSVGPSTGKITKYLPADEETGDGALFHVVHDADGDQEDLEEEEARLAIEAHREQAEAGGARSSEHCSCWSHAELRHPSCEVSIPGTRSPVQASIPSGYVAAVRQRRRPMSRALGRDQWQPMGGCHDHRRALHRSRI